MYRFMIEIIPIINVKDNPHIILIFYNYKISLNRYSKISQNNKQQQIAAYYTFKSFLKVIPICLKRFLNNLCDFRDFKVVKIFRRILYLKKISSI